MERFLNLLSSQPNLGFSPCIITQARLIPCPLPSFSSLSSLLHTHPPFPPLNMIRDVVLWDEYSVHPLSKDSGLTMYQPIARGLLLPKERTVEAKNDAYTPGQEESPPEARGMIQKLAMNMKRISARSPRRTDTLKPSLGTITEDRVASRYGLRSKVNRLASRPSADHSEKNVTLQRPAPRGQEKILPVTHALLVFIPPLLVNSDFLLDFLFITTASEGRYHHRPATPTPPSQ